MDLAINISGIFDIRQHTPYKQLFFWLGLLQSNLNRNKTPNILFFFTTTICCKVPGIGRKLTPSKQGVMSTVKNSRVKCGKRLFSLVQLLSSNTFFSFKTNYQMRFIRIMAKSSGERDRKTVLFFLSWKGKCCCNKLKSVTLYKKLTLLFLSKVTSLISNGSREKKCVLWMEWERKPYKYEKKKPFQSSAYEQARREKCKRCTRSKNVSNNLL